MPESKCETIADILFPGQDDERRKRIEQHRIEWERVHGPTDLTRRYVSMYPKNQQEIIARSDPKRYFDGLPPFMQDYVCRGLDHAVKSGKLDDCNELYIRLWMDKEFRKDNGFSR